MLSRYIRSINDLLARTSHQRTTSEKRTKLLLPKCPLFGGSTVFIIHLVRVIHFPSAFHFVALVANGTSTTRVYTASKSYFRSLIASPSTELLQSSRVPRDYDTSILQL